jgi:hypothetical protein
MKPTIAILVSVAVLAPASTASAAKPPKAPKGAPGLSAAAKPFVVTFGESTAVAGKLTGNNHGGQQVRLAQDPFPYGDGFLALAQATTAGNGTYSFRLLPLLNTNYRLTSGQVAASTGVRVRHAVSLAVSDSTPARGQLVRFFGSVRPKHDGKVVLIQRQAPTGGWSTVRRTTLLAATGNRSRYSTRMRVRSTRNYRARFVGDGAHLTGTSASRALTVH